jgi:hypothetical protein
MPNFNSFQCLGISADLPNEMVVAKRAPNEIASINGVKGTTGSQILSNKIKN